MEWRQRKHLIFIGVPVGILIILLVVIFVYVLGPTETSEAPVGKDIHVLWTRSLPIREGVIDVVALLENTNLNIGAESFSYLIKVYDENDFLIALREGKSYAFPQERFVVFEPSIEIQKRHAIRASLEIRSISWKSMSMYLSQLSVVKIERFLDKTPARLIVELDNPTVQKVVNKEITVLLFAHNQSVIGVSRTFLESILSGEKRLVFFSWKSAFSEQVESIDVFIRPENFIF